MPGSAAAGLIGFLANSGGAMELASALAARGSAAVLPLPRLGPAAAERMALACLGAADLPDPVQSVLTERAEGLPFLVEEVLAAAAWAGRRGPRGA